VRAARAAGLVVGHYVWPHTADPDSQVAHAVSVLDWQPGDLPVFLDYEDPENVPHAVLDVIRAGLRAHGLPTGTYTYPAYWSYNGDPNCQACTSDPLWLAAYQSRQPSPPAPWRNVTLWQYAGTSVTVPGIGGLNDMSRFIGTDQQFAALRGSAPQEDDVAQWWHDTDGTEWALDAVAKRRITSPAQRTDLQNIGLLSKTRRDVTTDVDRARLAQTPEVK
jgi:GH25 family lysozyme M1 (1,4-beta-N-acetylmuramidase)